MTAASRGKVMTGSVGDREKAGLFSPWRIAYGVGGCGEITGDVPVSPIRRRHHMRTVRFEQQ